MSDISLIALTCFVIVQVTNISWLLGDALLAKFNLPLITTVCQTYPVIGWGLVVFEILSPITLALHFFAG